MSLKPLLTRLAFRPVPLARTAATTHSATSSLSQSLQSAPQPARRTTYEIAKAAIAESTANSSNYQKLKAQSDLERGYNAQDLSRQVTRKWKQGDVYAPHDLSGTEMGKWRRMRRKGRVGYDVLDQLAINPLEQYKNFSIMSEYITEMGRIRHSSDTGLRPVNQRKMAKAIRRAMGMGLMPGVHRHPELLRREKKI